jgi:predicted Zn finger-like uncharacterized protein
MQLTCPNCNTQFSVPDNALGPDGRSVQCSRCQHVWHARADDHLHNPSQSDPPVLQPAASEPGAEVQDGYDSDADKPPIAVDDTTYADSPPPQTANAVTDVEGRVENTTEASPVWDQAPAAFAFREKPPRRRGWTRVIIGLLLLLAMAASYILRNDIAESVPASKRLYALAGIPLRQVGEGLAFVDVASRAATDNPQVLQVSGFVQNTSDLRRALPSVRIIVLDSQKNTLADVVRDGPAAVIDPRGVLRFSYDLPAPNQTVEGLQVEVQFIRQGKQ